MPAYTATAPGKIILFGEHAVVYGRPAIAVPVNQVRARVVAQADPKAQNSTIHIQAPDIGLEADLEALPEDDPLARAVRCVLEELGITQAPACALRITSTIPIASGLGSGAAVTVALARAFSAFLGHPLDDERVSALAFEIDKLYHGSPSGIDNTVITYAMPVYFEPKRKVETFRVPAPFTIVIGDTGVASPTGQVVGDVRRAWELDEAHYEGLFDHVGQIVRLARQAIESGELQSLGSLMDENQQFLQEMGVSSPELDRLVQAARQAGALGAKLSGGGRGGNMIALVNRSHAEEVAAALSASGAVRTLMTEVGT